MFIPAGIAQLQRQHGGGGGFDPTTLLTNLVSWWDFEEASGNLVDAHGSNNWVTVGTPLGYQTAGKVDFAIEADSSFDLCTIASGSGLGGTDRDFTVAGWIRIAAGGPGGAYPHIMANSNNSFAGGAGESWMLGLHPDAGWKARFSANVGASYPLAKSDTFGTLSNETWYFLVGIHDAVNSQIGISVNGGTIDWTALAGAINNGTTWANSLFRPADYNSNNFLGRVDSLLFTDEVLSTEAIEWLYNSGAGRKYADIGLPAGLVSWWSLDETTGTRVDSHGSNDMTDVATSVGYVTGLQGNAADIDGTDALRNSAPTGIPNGDGTVSMAGWVWLDTKGSVRFLVDRSVYGGITLADYSWYLCYESGADRYALYLRNGAWYFVNASTFGSPATGAWHFIYAYYDATTDELGISVNNGAINTTASVPAPQVIASNHLQLGCHSQSYYVLDGKMDEWLIADRLLTTDEVTWLYNSGAGRAYTDI